MTLNPHTLAVPDPDALKVQKHMSTMPDTEIVAGFVEGPGIERLALRFDVDCLRKALSEVLARTDYKSDHAEYGFGVIQVNRRPGDDAASSNDLSGRYWVRRDERYVEEALEDYVDEASFSELTPEIRGTYFEEVYQALADRFPLGRVRILSKGLYNCNSWHRDPEPRLHVPIVSNPGSIFIVNNFCTHLPADGSVYFTDTRGYHTAINGGFDHRVHLVAALAYPPVEG